MNWPIFCLILASGFPAFLIANYIAWGDTVEEIGWIHVLIAAIATLVMASVIASAG